MIINESLHSVFANSRWHDEDFLIKKQKIDCFLYDTHSERLILFIHEYYLLNKHWFLYKSQFLISWLRILTCCTAVILISKTWERNIIQLDCSSKTKNLIFFNWFNSQKRILFLMRSLTSCDCWHINWSSYWTRRVVRADPVGGVTR